MDSPRASGIQRRNPSAPALTEEHIQEIKDRVVKAASAGLSQIAHGGVHSIHSSAASSSSTGACNTTGNTTGGGGAAAASSASTNIPSSARSRHSNCSSSATSTTFNHTSSAPYTVTSTPLPPAPHTANALLTRSISNVWNFQDRDLFPIHQLHHHGQHATVAPDAGAHQEQLIVDELLHCLIGVRGTYIVPMTTGVAPTDASDDDFGSVFEESAGGHNADELAAITFNVSDRLAPALRAQVLEILPLASDYSCLQLFSQLCANASAGMVLQALGAALRTLLFDYYVFLVQLETEHLSTGKAPPGVTSSRLTPVKLLFFVRPTMAVFHTLAGLCRHIHGERLHGAQILSYLYETCTSLTGAPSTQAIVVQLTQSAARPYMEMLHLWIYKGIILPCSGGAAAEFLVDDNEHIRTDFIHVDHYSAEYWEKRYMIRADRVPSFLRMHADRILRAGKYLNVLRQCESSETGGGGSNAATRAPVYCGDGDRKDDDDDDDDAANVLVLTAALNGNRERSARQSHTAQAIPFAVADVRVHGVAIETAYTRAARTLLRVLKYDADLMGHLQSVRRYLLLAQGDFINQFMDAAEQELSKNVDRVQPMRLDNLLGLTLRVSSTKFDRYNEDLHCQLFPFELCAQMDKIHLAGSTQLQTGFANAEGLEYWHYRDEDQQPHSEKINLTGMECFAFRYEVRWPVSLVLNHFAVLEYQMLFRQLFYCKHVERQLCKVWKANNNANKFAPTTAELYRAAFTLRQRMMSAIQNVEYYMMIEVIEPTWHEFVAKLDTVSNVDEVLLVHQEFLDDCLYNCMLKTPELLRAITKLCNICLAFCKFIQKAQQHFIDAELTSMLRSDSSSDSDSDMERSGYKVQSESSMAPTETFAERIKRFDLEFTFVLIGLLKQINEIAYEDPNSKLINLVHRINFNSFYNAHLEQMSCKNAKVNFRSNPSGGAT